MADATQMVAELMALSARTAPKSMGQDYVNIRVNYVQGGHCRAQAGHDRGIYSGGCADFSIFEEHLV